MLPQYCGTLLEQALMMNRRRHDYEEYPQSRMPKIDPSLDDSVSTTGSIMSEGERAKTDGADSIMYPPTQTSSSKDECPPLMPSSATLPQMLAMTANVCAHRKFSKILATKTSNLDCTLDLTPVRPNDEQ